MPNYDDAGTRVFQAPSQTQAAIRLKDYGSSPVNSNILEVERVDGSRIPYRSDDELRMLAEGLLAQTGPRQYIPGQAVPGAGTLRFCSFYARRGLILNNAVILLGNANGTGVTLAKVGIWRTDGTLLAGTPDFSAGINSGTLPRAIITALTAQWIAPADALYWTGVLQVGGTPASLGCTSTGNYGGVPIAGSGTWPYGQVSSQSDLANFNPASIASSSGTPWVGFT